MDILNPLNPPFLGDFGCWGSRFPPSSKLEGIQRLTNDRISLHFINDHYRDKVGVNPNVVETRHAVSLLHLDVLILVI